MNQLAIDFRPHFDGLTYDPALDHERLTVQLNRVKKLMSDGLWRSLETISKATGDKEASVSARLRDLRKPKFGGYQIDRRRFGGLFEYRMRTV